MLIRHLGGETIRGRKRSSVDEESRRAILRFGLWILHHCDESWLSRHPLNPFLDLRKIPQRKSTLVGDVRVGEKSDVRDGVVTDNKFVLCEVIFHYLERSPAAVALRCEQRAAPGERRGRRAGAGEPRLRTPAHAGAERFRSRRPRHDCRHGTLRCARLRRGGARRKHASTARHRPSRCSGIPRSTGHAALRACAPAAAMRAAIARGHVIIPRDRREQCEW